MTDSDLISSRILIVDDKRVNIELLEEILKLDGYCNLTSTVDPRRVPEIHDVFDPDLVLLDLHMPHLDGFELLKRLTAGDRSLFLPILVLTADITPEAKLQALSSGAKDFLAKPFDVVEVRLRIRKGCKGRKP